MEFNDNGISGKEEREAGGGGGGGGGVRHEPMRLRR